MFLPKGQCGSYKDGSFARPGARFRAERRGLASLLTAYSATPRPRDYHRHHLRPFMLDRTGDPHLCERGATRRYAEKILKTSDGLIAISTSARNETVDILRNPEERIQVIYPGVANHSFMTPERRKR